MRIRPQHSPPPFLNRRDQRRMLMMVLLLVAVVVSIRVTARPGFWWWMFPPSESQPAEDRTQQTPPPIDHSIVAESPLSPDEFRSAAGSNTVRSDSANRQTGNPRPTAGAVETEPQRDNPAPSRPEPPPLSEDGPAPGSPQSAIGQAAPGASEFEPQDHAFVEISPDAVELPAQLFESVVDRRLRIHRDEAGAYFQILEHLQRLDPVRLADAARHDANYTVLMTEPDFVRGQPVTLRGSAKRVIPLEVGPNPFGIETLYDVWFFTPDSGNSPLHVRCLELPAGMPARPNMSPMVEIEVTGYFFRIEGYETADGVYTAPLLLARTVNWLKAPVAESSRRDVIPYVAGFAMILATLTGMLLVWFRLSDRRFARSAAARLTRPQEASFEDLDTVTPEEYLSQLPE